MVLLGISLATLAALMWAVQFLCVRLGTDDGKVLDAVLISLCCNVALVVPLVLLIYPVSELLLFTPFSLLSFVLAGVAGSFLGRVLLFESIETIGASRTSPVVSANVFFATLLAVVFLEETLTGAHFGGIVLIVAGVAVISWETAASAADTQSARELGASLLLPVLAAACIGVEPVFISLGLAEGTPALPGVMIKVVAAAVGFLAYLRYRRGAIGWPKRSSSTKWYLGAGLTTTAGLISYFTALEFAPVVVVVPIMQTTPLLVVVLSAIFLPKRLENVNYIVGVAAVVVVVGTGLVALSG